MEEPLLTTERLMASLIPTLVTGIAGLVGILLIQVGSARIRHSVEKAQRLEMERRQQILTILGVAQWGITILVTILVTLMILGKFIDVTPMLTGLGVAGLAVSLGGQTLVKDFIGGIFILLENQYSVGDVIQVGSVSGGVEQLTLRATYIRDLDGKLHIVPNGEIRIVSNITKEWSRAVVKIGVAYEEEIERTMDVLLKAAQKVVDNPAFTEQILEPPAIFGPNLGDWAVNYTVLLKTAPGKHWAIGRELQKQIHITFKEEGIVSPYPRQEVFFVTENPGTEMAA